MGEEIMAESRGKKGKKGRWQIDLGPKELIFAGLGVAGLLMMCFALGTLAGRGDIYRVLVNWGLLGPETLKTVALPTGPSGTAVVPATAASQPQEGAVVPPTVQAPATAKETPGTGQGSGPSAAGTHAAQKKPALKDAKKSDETLKKIKKEVAPNLVFLNKQEQAAKNAPGNRGKGKDKAATKTGPTLVFVAKYRDAKRAQAKVAEMRKQGDQVFLKEGKDQEGAYVAIYRQLPGSTTKTPVVAQHQPKTPKPPQKTGKTSTSHQ
jgi:hypothetical protein